MELKDFMKAVISAITEIIEEVNREGKGKIIANPDKLRFVDNKLVYPMRESNKNILEGRLVQELEFSLALTESKNVSNSGSLRLNVINVGAKNQKSKDNMSVVKFTIPIVFLV